jgi:hypothetical protein
MIQEEVLQPPGPVGRRRQDEFRLLGLSFLMLFLELALIRWLGANVLYLGFFSNLILLGSFLGIGLGFLVGKSGRRWVTALPLTLFALVGSVLAFPVEVSRSSSDIIFFGDPNPSGLPIWVVVPVVFALVVAVMAMIAHEVAIAFAKLRPLVAYSWDIGGSLLGIVGFTVLSFLRAPPLAWAVAAAGGLLILVRGWARRDVLALGGVVFLLGVQSFSPGLSWSAYYQVRLTDIEGRSHILVNGIPHQNIMSVEELSTTIYNQPYEFAVAASPGRVLIIGAGSGNDVSLALANGAQSVDAVEIDRRINELGQEIHPDNPYDDPRVKVVIDDGRAFMERSTDSYDLILFALPDSLTLLSGQASLRLESYLFTVEAVDQARSLLAPDGAFVMYNFYREDWLIDRLTATVANVFDRQPCVVSIGDVERLALIAVGGTSAERCPGSMEAAVGAPSPASDDYPFLYLRDRAIPSLYLLTLGLIVVVSLATVRVGVGPLRGLRPYLDLFALGAAFLLLETKSVVQFALWFGTTWVVNALVFAGILVAVLGAVLVARRSRLPRPMVLYGLLFVSLAVAWAIPPEALLDLAVPIRWVAASALTFAPVFLANLIFAQRFARTASATAAFGANLLGALFGGVAEYAALVVGYRSLIVLAALIYLAALLLTPRSGQVDAPEERVGVTVGSR